MIPRLATVAPDVVEVLEQESSARLRAVAISVSEWIVGAVHLFDPRIDAAFVSLQLQRFGESPERAALQLLVNELDESAWNIRDEVAAGTASEEDYLRAFARARPASAVWFAADADPLRSALESVYEAQAATGDLEGLRRRLNAVLA